MNILDFRAELELDQTWRQDEIRFLHNECAKLSDEANKQQFRRALILLIYAHLEGFCKFALMLYVKGINSSNILCAEAVSAVAACSLSELFAALRDPQRKSHLFSEVSVEDKLQRFAREEEFIAKAYAFLQVQVKIPDKVVDTESNLSSTVLKKNLYRLGIPLDVFSPHSGNIDMLLRARNQIAHGEKGAGIPEAFYDKSRKALEEIMNGITREIYDAFANKQYKKAT